MLGVLHDVGALELVSAEEVLGVDEDRLDLVETVGVV